MVWRKKYTPRKIKSFLPWSLHVPDGMAPVGPQQGINLTPALRRRTGSIPRRGLRRLAKRGGLPPKRYRYIVLRRARKAMRRYRKM